jgi:hypothetical protein
MEKLNALLAVLARIKEITGSEYSSLIKSARGKPDERAGSIRNLRISAEYSSRMTSEQENLAQRIFREMANTERKAGQAEGAALLRSYASEFEALRAVLPSLAASASIEMGAIARSLVTEADEMETAS